MTTYYMIPTQNLPLLDPVRQSRTSGTRLQTCCNPI